MRYLNIDWAGFAQLMPIWRSLSESSRQCLLGLNSTERLPRRGLREEDIEALTAKDMIAFDAKGRRFHLAPGGREFFKAVRAMGRHPLHDELDDRHAADEYAAEHLTQNEHHALLLNASHGGYRYGYGAYRPPAEPVTRRRWLDDWLKLGSASKARKWEGLHLPQQSIGAQFQDGSPYFDDAALFDATRQLVEAALTWPRPVPIDELPQHLPDVDPPVLWRAVMAAIRYFLLFPRLGDDNIPVIGIWPYIAYLLHRPAPVLPAPAEPVETFHAPYRMEDMAGALIAAAEEPLRLLASGEGLYQKDFNRLTERMMPAPEWLLRPEDVERIDLEAYRRADWNNRAYCAVRECLDRGLMVVRDSARNRTTYESTDAGRDWLARDPQQRLAELLEPWRREPDADAGHRNRGAPRLRLMREDGEVVAPADAAAFSPWMPESLRWGDVKVLSKVDWRGAFVDALACDDADQFRPFAPLLAYHARLNNPLLGRRVSGSYGPAINLRRNLQFSASYEPSELDIENTWYRMLAATIERELGPLGGVEMGYDGQRVLVRLHGIGRYMLGLDDDFALQAQAEGAVIVQPNFEVMFMGPSPAAEATVARLAERTGQRMGAMFRLTRGSVLAAAAAGIRRDDALRDLEQASSKPLPDNVRREVAGWFNSVARVGMREAWIVDTPDEPTTARVLAAAGKKARRLTPTTVEILSPRSSHSTLIRKLKQAGVFVNGGKSR